MSFVEPNLYLMSRNRRVEGDIEITGVRFYKTNIMCLYHQCLRQFRKSVPINYI